MPRSYPDRPYVGIGVVVFKDDQVLLVQRAKPPIRHMWSIPGGAQEIGETVREGALRELKEETALDAEIIGLIDVVDSVTRMSPVTNSPAHAIASVICATVGRGFGLSMSTRSMRIRAGRSSQESNPCRTKTLREFAVVGSQLPDRAAPPMNSSNVPSSATSSCCPVRFDSGTSPNGS